MANEAHRKSKPMTHAPVVVGVAGGVPVAEVRQRLDEMVAMGYEHMLRERLDTNRPTEEKARLKFLLL